MSVKKTDKRLIFLLATARQRLMSRLNSALAGSAGITAAQAAALFFLKDNGGCTHTELSRGLLLDNSAITGLVDRLEKRGLARRQISERDRRAIRLEPTDAGIKAAAAALPVLGEFNAAIQKGFTPSEIDTFARVLASIVNRFQSVPAKGGQDK